MLCCFLSNSDSTGLIEVKIKSQNIINQQFIETKQWKDAVIWALGNEVNLISMKVENDYHVIYGQKTGDYSNKLIINKIKDGFHKATHAGDPYIINEKELYINYKSVNVIFE